MPPRKIYTDLPANLTFVQSQGLYRYRNPLTRKFAWSSKDKKEAIEKAIKSNQIIDLKREQNRIARGADGTLRYVIRMYIELVLPTKAWSKGTQVNKLAKINKLDKLFGHYAMAAIDQVFIGDHLNEVATSGDVYMKWREVWIELCSFAMSRNLVTYNAAHATLPRTTSKKLAVNRRRRVNLELEQYNIIYNHPSCPEFLKLAMDASLLTLQARTEIVNCLLTDFKDDGYLYFIRQKTAGDTDMSFIRFEINDQIADLKRRSQEMMMKAGYRSPYLIHRLSERKHFGKHTIKRLKAFGVIDAFLSKTFAQVRDNSKVFANLPHSKAPATFHSIRGLGGRLLKENHGWSESDVQRLYAHSSRSTTKNLSRKRRRSTHARRLHQSGIWPGFNRDKVIIMKNLEQWNFDHHLYFCYHLPSDIHLSKLVKEGSDFGASIKLQMHHTKCKYVHTSPHQAMKDLNLTQNMEYIKKV